jgi:hypothetical protein
MSEKLIRALMPAHPDYHLIYQNFRNKYNIPEINTEEEESPKYY